MTRVPDYDIQISCTHKNNNESDYDVIFIDWTTHTTERKSFPLLSLALDWVAEKAKDII